MNILLLDCETNGKPKDYKASVKDVDNWPRVIQLAWQLVNEWGDKVISKGNYFIKPDGWTVPNEEFWITHNLTQERCVSE
jgi:DNA polymerase-3 subunit alpha